MLLEVKNIKVRYDKVEALKGISLTTPEDAIVTLLGGNGAGKTTTLNAISGIVNIVSGEIWFKGERIDKLPGEKIVAKGVAQVPEGRKVFPFMTVFENMKIGAYHRKWNNEVSKDIEMLYEHFPRLQERRNQKAGSLSGGEQQMLVMARALMAKPDLLLLDEPSLGLSPILVEEIARIITEIHNRGVATILVEQNARMALGLSQFGYVLEVGQIVLEGDTKELSQDPRVKAAYLGG
jgi:branched-chain amino acid transport system ATP-binding protein